MCLFWSKETVGKIKWLVRKLYISKSVIRILAWPTYMMLVRTECQYVLSNLAAGYTRSILLCLIVGRSNCKFLEKNLHVHLIIMKEWPKNNSPILRNLDNFPPGVFYSTHLQLVTKEYLTCWKIIFVYIKPNCRYCLRKSLQCYRTNTGNIIW